MPQSTPTIVPYLGYKNARAAIDFLKTAFGFNENQAYADENGTVLHAELSVGNGVIMIGTGADEQRSEELTNMPAGRGLYIVVDDIEAHFERAKKAGAHVVWEPHDTEFGTKRYRVLDVEGYEWSFGTYQPAS